MKILKQWLRILARSAAICTLWSSSALAAYPSSPITLIVPFGAGGITDLVARATAKVLEEQLGETIIVDNRPGAGGNIAAERLKHSKPDGHTLMFTSIGVLAVNPHTGAGVTFDSLNDFTYISTVASTPHVIVVNPAVKAKSLKELIELTLGKPESISFGTAGIGSSPYQGMTIMQESTGVKFLHVPFKSGAESVTSVVGHQVEMTFEATPVVMPFVQAGKLRALALANSKRIDGAPDLPSTAELGYPDILSASISGLIGPAGLPKSVVDKLNQATQKALKNQHYITLLSEQGTATESSTPEEFRSAVSAEYDKWEEIMAKLQTQAKH
ncbi:Bug family tripartite tricarboxylate transporter substrate binding protein [Allopusillimonas ginsengisoli]|uniref:Bug family tripartite tricarboxylate transporter substrate binding protein n=1 Tax=Allopusillimonas ginsengisoli TaxID=453575 RepID=UPI0010218D5D|nr:tripartite tricarboxylate transporter substrate binding protein [Allopusillimonas ginsengisoli]TEA79625.1 tripartite tricarboxylate transporter substrate binding protein [Allopusillimonas ginsengisoli]